MAELAIGAASISLQIAESIIKLKNFWSLVKEAPDDIAFIIEELELFRDVASDIETDLNSGDTVALAMDTRTDKKCLDFCKKAADVLHTICKELAKELEKGKMRGGFKTALRKETIDRLRERLRNAQSLLLLSQQIFTHTMQKRLAEEHRRRIQEQSHTQAQWAGKQELQIQELSTVQTQLAEKHERQIQELRDIQAEWAGRHELQIRELSTMQTQWAGKHERQIEELSNAVACTSLASTSSSTDCVHSWLCPPGHSWLSSPHQTSNSPDCAQVETRTEQHRAKPEYRRATRALKRQKRFRLFWETPRWLPITQRAWQFCGYSDMCGWTYTLKTFITVDLDDEVFDLCWKGDVVRLQELFSEGKASPLIRDPDGGTLLDLAVRSSKLECVQFLLDVGLDANDSDESTVYDCFDVPLFSRSNQTDVSIARILCASIYDFDIFQRKGDACFCFRTVEFLDLALQASGLDYMRSDEESLEIAIMLDPSLPTATYVNLIQHLFPGGIADSTAGLSASSVRTLLHHFFQNLANYMISIGVYVDPDLGEWTQKSSSDETLSKLQSLVRDLGHAGADLSAAALNCMPSLTRLRDLCLPINPNTADISKLQRYVRVALNLWIKMLFEAGVDLVKYGKRTQELHSQNQSSHTTSRFHDHDDIWCSCQLELTFTYGPKPENWEFHITSSEVERW